MYARHFGLLREPFSIAPDPRSLFMSERHREALAHLLYGLQSGGGFVLLTGEIGTGKTTVCRAFLEQVPALCKVAYIVNPRLNVGELLQTVCEEFGIEVAAPGAKAQVDALNQFLLATHAAGGQSVLVIDEAQKLASSVLEQLRLLTNLETNERKLLQIILIGQPELRTKLARPELEQLAQRVVARYHLGALEPRDIEPYMSHRLAVAGLQGAMPFDTRALRRIHHWTGGVPRRINLLADRALLGAYAGGQSSVSVAMLDQAAGEAFDLRAEGWRAWFMWPRPVVPTLATLALVAAGLWWARPNAPAPAPVLTPAHNLMAVAAATSSVSPSSAALAMVAAASAAPTVASTAPAASAVLTPNTSAAFASLAGAQRQLATLWSVTLGDGEPCEQAQRQALQCFRGQAMTLAQLRQLARPGVVTLLPEGGAATPALLLALGEQSARLSTGAQEQTVTLAAFGRAWRGDFMSYWRGGSATAPASWLEQQLFQLDPTAATKPLPERVMSFQRAQGLSADGVAGAMTLMQLNRALGVAEPRLQGERQP